MDLFSYPIHLRRVSENQQIRRKEYKETWMSTVAHEKMSEVKEIKMHIKVSDKGLW